jgi:phage-related minor tail protein
MHSESEGTMLKPAFIDGTILAFNKIGTKECMFLIDDSIDESKKICSLDSVKKYLLKVEAEESEKTKKIEAQKKAEEQQRLLILQEKNRIEDEARVKEEQRRADIINSYTAKEKRLKEENTYEAYSHWYSILRCKDVYIDIYMSASFYLIWAGLCILAGGSLFLILANKPSTIFVILALLSPAIMLPIAIILSGYFERWRKYKKHKKYYDEYTQKNKECITNFSFKVFYDIKYSYESLVHELSELEREKEEALNA